MKCHYDDRQAWYRCARTGEYVCPEHARLDVVSVATRTSLPPLAVRPAGAGDREAIRQVALRYWEETEVDCFGRTYDLLSAPALLAMADDEVAGVLSYVMETDEDRLNVVMLNVHAKYHGRHAARSLLVAAEEIARTHDVSRLVVATSNDDLPALYLYQRCGFVLTEIVPCAILRHHGHVEAGFAGIPVRDEIHLERTVGSQTTDH